MIAGIGTPWGPNEGDGDPGGYHLVWPRDMYKFANALITAGDAASATNAVNWLFNVYMNPLTGRFPQNSYVNGTPNWNATQMDEQAMPIILAYRLGPSVYNALWPKIQLTANYIYSSGPWTQEERWEENERLFALDDRRRDRRAGRRGSDRLGQQRSRRCGELAERRRHLAAERHRLDLHHPGLPRHQQQLQQYPDVYADQHLRPAGRRLARRLESSFYPNPNMSIEIGNNGGTHRAIDIIDGGFLELVRMGIKRPNDPTIANSLLAYDSVIKQTVGPNNYPAWFRYNFDGYGETNAGLPYDGLSGRGRLWPIFDAERGNYEIAATGTGGAGSPYLTALKAFSPQGFISEQIWNASLSLPGDTDNPSGWAVTTPAGDAPGAITGSMEPLNWAQGEYITLLADIAAGAVLDIPQAVCARYSACARRRAPVRLKSTST